MSAGLDRERLVAVLGMLGSAHDGEILAAARQAERLRRGAGLTWHDILTPAPERSREVETIDDAIELCQCYPDRLTAWEGNFVANLSRQRSAISPKQISVLDQIVAKVHRAEARAA